MKLSVGIPFGVRVTIVTVIMPMGYSIDTTMIFHNNF